MMAMLRARLQLVGMVTVMMAGSLSSQAADHASAEQALMAGRADEAVTMLNQLVATNQKDAAAHLLLCRTYFSEELMDRAVNECEAALSNGLNKDSRAQDWMGRAYGRKADGAGPFTGLSLAKKVKNAFETAVELDPNNADAVNDLSEYYVGAPSIVGGGLDKARALATRVETRLPQAAHRIRAMAAEKSKDYGAAEQEFRAAVGAGGHPDAWVDLADFYVRRKQKDQAVSTVRKALEADKARDASLVDIGSMLDTLKAEPQLAENSLRAYLASDAKSDAAPAFRAHTILGRILANNGNVAAAKNEYQAALALAKDYAPARKALQSQ